MNRDELMHYGVLGMKWGVRRYQNKMNKQANKAKGRDLLLLERTIPAGTKMYRTSTKKMEDNNGPRYISYLNVDRNHYKDGWVKEGYDPLIIFDSGNLTQTKSKKISNREEYESYQKDKKWKEKANKNTSAKWSDVDMIGKRIMNNDELMHYGILGMKWGVRRYQNKDGTLTKAGKRKAAKMKAEYTELTGKQLRKSPTKKATSTSSEAPSKKISEMSDTELKEKANRLRLEKEYISAERERSALTPKDVNKGKAFVDTLTEKVLKPALIDAGKAVVKNYTQAKLQDILGVEVSKTGPRIRKPGDKPDKDDDKD